LSHLKGKTIKYLICSLRFPPFWAHKMLSTNIPFIKCAANISKTRKNLSNFLSTQ
jgi:hypothetical protein